MPRIAGVRVGAMVGATASAMPDSMTIRVSPKKNTNMKSRKTGMAMGGMPVAFSHRPMTKRLTIKIPKAIG